MPNLTKTAILYRHTDLICRKDLSVKSLSTENKTNKKSRDIDIDKSKFLVPWERITIRYKNRLFFSQIW